MPLPFSPKQPCRELVPAIDNLVGIPEERVKRDKHALGISPEPEKAVSVHNVRDTDKRFRQERQRVEILVRYSSVNRAHSCLAALIILEVKHVLLNKKIGVLYKRRACFFGEIRMLEIGGVVSSGRKDHVDAAAVYVVHYLALSADRTRPTVFADYPQ